MAFSVLELFKKNQPIEFYHFGLGPAVWRFTSADIDVTYLGEVYVSGQLKRSRIVWSGDLAQQHVTIKVPIGSPLAQAWTRFPAGASGSVRIFAQHRGAGDVTPLFGGRYVNFKFRGPDCELRFDSILTQRREQGLRRTASPHCPHTLYDTAAFSCGIAKAGFKTSFAADAVSGVNVSGAPLAAHPDGYYAGGLLEYLRADGVLERRSIDTHVVNTVVLRAPIDGLIAGETVDVYPGCDHSLQTCNDKFANSANYGGLPFIPEVNPYDGNPIF